MGSYRVRMLWAKRGTFMIIYGYARVSTIGQTLAAQEATLHEAGAAKVFKEKISGAANHRAQLHRLLKTIDAGDLVIVTRLDRLARSTRDLLNILDTIAKAGAAFKSLGDAWADTTTAHGRLMLTVLGGLAEFERELIRVRTGEGRVRAKARGVHMGRPFKLNRHQQREAIARRSADCGPRATSPSMPAVRLQGQGRPPGRSAGAKCWGVALTQPSPNLPPPQKSTSPTLAREHI